MAVINVFTHGNGTVEVYRNGQLLGTVPGNWNGQRYTFAMRDAFRFKAFPNEGWAFQRFCGDEACSFAMYNSEFADYVNAEYGEVHAFFAPSAESLVEQERKERRAADDSLGSRISSLDSWVTGYVMQILGDIQEVAAEAEQGIGSLWTAIADLEARLKAWMEDMVFELLLKKLVGR